ncbi:hypothetical protein [Gordonia jacobaea]|uniref:hypothetical protein n=1 Tax=Gordonia jacobaea TaxID=122202 RepID=UPI0022E37254|nr:hypothetical protein [Gordonia jacobaea]
MILVSEAELLAELPEIIPFCTECGGRVYQRMTTGLWWHYHARDFYGSCDWGRPFPSRGEEQR